MSSSRVRYASLEQGRAVAFVTRGAGAPLLVVENLGVSSTTLALADVGFVSRLADRRTTVSFDFPGIGFSDADPVDMSLSAQVTYMQAIVRELGAGPVDVYGWGPSAAPAVALAARAPSEVRKLVLANPCVRFAEMDTYSPLVKVLQDASADFGFYVTTVLSLLGVPPPQQSALHRALVDGTPKSAARLWLDAMERFDASDDLARVMSATLVLQARSNPLVPPRHVASIAAGIPGARLVRVETAPMGGMLPENLDLVLDFLDDRGDQPRPVRDTGRRGLKIIVFTDVENHTEMMQRLGDDRGREVLREHERLTTDALRRHGGSVMKAMGDGFLATFDSAQEALSCGAELQRAFASRSGEPVKVRIGINAGEPINDGDDLYGASVIVAARVAAQARGGEILVSNVVRELAVGKGFPFSERGPIQLKGIEEPVRLFELRWSEEPLP